MKKVVLLMIMLSMFLLTSVSVFAGTGGPVANITITPNPMDKFTTVVASFNQPVNVGINVETEQGEVVKTLYWGPVTEQITLTWNRISDTGAFVPSGRYILMVNYQERYTSTKKTLILK